MNFTHAGCVTKISYIAPLQRAHGAQRCNSAIANFSNTAGVGKLPIFNQVRGH